MNDPFGIAAIDEATDDFASLARQSIAPRAAEVSAVYGAVTAKLHGFGIDERPLVVGVPHLPDEVVPARTTMQLLKAHKGATVVLVFDKGDVRRPIIVGVLQDEQPVDDGAAASAQGPLVTIHNDDDRLVLRAEREISLVCGDASITLTRAGKVLIKGSYVLSRSAGYNKIKGAAVEIN